MILNARTNGTHFDFDWNSARNAVVPRNEHPSNEQENLASVGISVQQLDAALDVISPYLTGNF